MKLLPKEGIGNQSQTNEIWNAPNKIEEGNPVK